ncbi:caspase-9 isoform X1 [Podarcis lilfordi]|uniref:Caspase-9 isoform X1 n=1 Tax=Podarcis lilfordi TaxID=74358 RepID=A0AA35PES4_9SAUR|nr:caspase-9 isoform X1 [Podarcis lilfordi]
MEEDHRQSLRRARLRLVKELQVEPLWDLLLHQEIFTPDMIEEIQKAGTRRDQARQLVIDLQTRGKRAFPAFIWCLQETGQNDLAALLSTGGDQPQLHPADLKPVEIRPRSEPRDPRITTSGNLPFPVQELNERRQKPSRDITATRGSVEENTRRNAETVYVLRTDPCGYCLIINNVNFSSTSGLSSRAGSDVDCEKLEKRFRSLRFEVLTRRDLKAQEIVTELQSLATRDHSSLDCCLVVLLSHGCQRRRTEGLKWILTLLRSSRMHLPSRCLQEALIRRMQLQACPPLVTSWCLTLLFQVLCPGGISAQAPGMLKPWITCWNNMPIPKTFSTCS